MILGALVDVGVELSLVQKELKKLDLTGYKVKSQPVMRGMISGIKVDVEISRSKAKHGHHHHRSFSDIKKMIERSSLSDSVKSHSLKIFKKIAQVEAAIHRTTIGKIHFHEVGAVDSIVDIIGGVVGLEMLNLDAIYCSPINTGEGTVVCDHGVLPVPAPATLKLLEGVPCYSNGVQKELATPTGVAMMGHFAKKFISMPMMTILNSGFGAGSHIIQEKPNLLRLILGEVMGTGTEERIAVIETNIDDMNPEFYEYVMESLFTAGAVDVFLTPIHMKKNRPAVKLTVLTLKEKRDDMVKILLSETSTFGVRCYEMERFTLERKLTTVTTPYGKVKIKMGCLNGDVLQIAPEYEDCKRISRSKKVSLKMVYDSAQQLANKKFLIS